MIYLCGDKNEFIKGISNITIIMQTVIRVTLYGTVNEVGTAFFLNKC